MVGTDPSLRSAFGLCSGSFQRPLQSPSLLVCAGPRAAAMILGEPMAQQPCQLRVGTSTSPALPAQLRVGIGKSSTRRVRVLEPAQGGRDAARAGFKGSSYRVFCRRHRVRLGRCTQIADSAPAGCAKPAGCGSHCRAERHLGRMLRIDACGGITDIACAGAPVPWLAMQSLAGSRAGA